MSKYNFFLKELLHLLVYHVGCSLLDEASCVVNDAHLGVGAVSASEAAHVVEFVVEDVATVSS